MNFTTDQNTPSRVFGRTKLFAKDQEQAEGLRRLVPDAEIIVAAAQPSPGCFFRGTAAYPCNRLTCLDCSEANS